MSKASVAAASEDSSSQRQVCLDLMRGLAALMVGANHLRAVTMVDYQSLSVGSAFTSIFYAVTSFGHQAVIVFFVLSGYFVGGSLLAKGEFFSWGQYAISRLTRLWVVLIPALLLTAGIDYGIGLYVPDVLSGSYSDVWHLGPRPDGCYSATAAVFFGNLFFLQTIFVPVFGSNDPLWSLAYEFWYYVAFPLLLIGIGRLFIGRRILFSCLAVIAAVGILACLPWLGQIGFICWLGGVAVYVFRIRWLSSRVALFVALWAFVAGLGLSRWLGGQGVSAAIVDLEMALTTMFLVAALTSQWKCVRLWRPVSWLAFHLSELSYSFYLIHFPIVLSIGGIALHGQRLLPDAAGLVAYLGWLVVLLLGTWCFWFLFERRTNQVRSLMMKVFACRAK